MNDLPDTTFDNLASTALSRRGLLRAGGFTAAMTAILAACSHIDTDKKPARVGDAPAPTNLPQGVVTDGVLFRSATSIHYSIINSHNIAKKLGKFTADDTALVDDFIAGNQAAIKTLQQLSTKAGSQPWSCSNPRFDRVVLTPIREHITGRPKQGTEENDVPPSDDSHRDALALVYGMETLAAAMHQTLVPQFSKPEYRAAAMAVGQTAARRSAAAALYINSANTIIPASVLSANVSVTTTTAPATTTTVQNIAQAGGATTTTNPSAGFAFQEYYAVSSQFGTLSAVQLGIGKPVSNTQFTINIETPSLNSFIYDYQGSADCVAFS
jgi:hypothetical protein